jgi:DNA transformation protein
MTPMRVSDGFRAFVLDQLSGVRDLRDERMFGGIGLYCGDVFFGIIAADVLYFKVGDSNRADYDRAGAEPFQPYAGRTSMSYYAVPPAVLENAATLAQWAARAILVARSKVLAGPRRADVDLPRPPIRTRT